MSDGFSQPVQQFSSITSVKIRVHPWFKKTKPLFPIDFQESPVQFSLPVVLSNRELVRSNGLENKLQHPPAPVR
ncbi:MAG TPA: hypothetical protein DIW81_23295 [Planctomycetaceae bacterium]|nr:hypothetical protein [Rubinisphaera sp.]HCS54473.1 hypothetical protein [Planctomycetaceae bacterium]